MTELFSAGPGTSASGVRSSLDRVLEAVQARGGRIQSVPGGYKVTCPVHDDRTPSLSVTWTQGPRCGLVMLKCHGCQAGAAEIMDELNLPMSDLFDEPLPERDTTFNRVGKSPARRSAGRRRGRLGGLPVLIPLTAPVEEPTHTWVEVQRYPYVDLDSQLVQENVRRECTSCPMRHKTFYQAYVTPTGRRVTSKPSGFAPVLYRALEVAAAVADGQPIWLVEGEKDVHTAEGLGVVATTNAGGGRGFPDELIGQLRGADVRVVLDRDDTGWARGLDLHTRLTAAECTVTLMLPAVAKAKADLTDHVEAGQGIDQLLTVGVVEVETWHALAAAKPKATLIHQAVDQARARWELAEQGEQVEDNRRYAKRWVLESQIRQEALRELVDQVYARGAQAGSMWASEALKVAHQMLTHATDEARQCHHDLGEPVPESLRAPLHPTRDQVTSGSATSPDPGADGAGKRGFDAGTRPSVFRILDDQIVQWEPDRTNRRRGEDDEEGGKFKVLLSMVVRVTAREYLETAQDADADQPDLMGRATLATSRQVSAPRRLVAMRLEFADQITGEAMEIRVMADQWDDHSWLKSLPNSPDYDHRRAGLDQLQRAILAVSDKIDDVVLHQSTGWREAPDGTHRYIHARGAITATGHEYAPVAFDRVLSRYDLPDPSTDPELLRQAWFEASMTMLDRLPERVAAPVLGQMFRSVLGHNEWVLVLVGSPGSFKTSVACKAMHHFGERWDHNKPATSASGNGDTLNALRLKLHYTKDALAWLDDFAPTKSQSEAQKHLAEAIRMISNQEGRSRASRDGLSTSDGTIPMASGLITSEVMPPPGSAAERALVVTLGKTDIDRAQLFPLDEPDSRYQRALVMSSFISWLAGDLSTYRARYRSQAAEYAEVLIEDAGETIRAAQALANTWVGWAAITDFLVARGAISAAERQITLDRVGEALLVTGQAAFDPDVPRTTGARVLELISFALNQGLAYVDDVRDGGCPPWPLAGRLGWRRTATELDAAHNPIRTRLERNGVRGGYVLHDPGPREASRGQVLMCNPTQLEAMIKAANAQQTEKLEIDRATAARALLDEGVLIPSTDRSDKGTSRLASHCTIYAEGKAKPRMYVLRLDRLLGYDDPDAEDDPTSPPPGPPSSDPTPDDAAPGGDPHLLDSLTVSEQGGTVVLDEHDTGPDHTPEEPSMVPPAAFTPFTVRDRDGVVGAAVDAEPGQRGPCDLCGQSCTTYLAGGWMHPGCWANSTTADRATEPQDTTDPVARSRDAVPEPVTEPAGAPAAGEPAGSPHDTAGSPKATSKARFRATAAVVGVDRIWLSNGECIPMPGQGPTHIGDLARLAEWLRLGTQVTRYHTEPGQIWVTAELACAMGIDVDALLGAPDRNRYDVTVATTKGLPAVTAAIAAGYSSNGGESLKPWTRVWKGKDRSVFVVLIPAMTHEPADVALMGDLDPARLARRLGLLAEALGYPFKISASTTGVDLMTALRKKDRDTFFTVRETIPPAQIGRLESDITWSRRPTEEELTHTWVHAYDRSGSYLAGVAGLELGVGEAVHHPQGTAFVPRLPGYWRIEIPESGDWRMPHPLDPTGRYVGKTRWVTTPGLDFAVEQGYDPQILEAYTWDRHARILDPWYNQLRDARTRLDLPDQDSQVARNQVKQIYVTSIGMIGSETFMKNRPEYAPDRRHMIVAKARTNILRRVAKIGEETGRWPVAIATDTVVYTSNEEDPELAWPGGPKWLGRNLGQYKPEGSALLVDHLQHLTGDSYQGRGRAALVGADHDGE